jgi:hypothetical protein
MLCLEISITVNPRSFPLLIPAIGYNFAMNLMVTGLTLAGAALPAIVLASDCRNSNPDDLTDEFAAHSYNPLPLYYKWYFACGLAIGFLSMGIPHLRKNRQTNSRLSSTTTQTRIGRHPDPQTVSYMLPVFYIFGVDLSSHRGIFAQFTEIFSYHYRDGVSLSFR